MSFSNILIQAAANMAVQAVTKRLSPERHRSLTRSASFLASVFTTDCCDISLGRHPLQDLFEKSLHGQISDLKKSYDAIPKNLRDDLDFEVYKAATEHDKGGEGWGGRNALNNLPRLAEAIKALAIKRFECLSQEQKNHICAATTPEQLKANPAQLICALHRHHHLEILGKRIRFSDLEKGTAEPSSIYHLNRPNLLRGQIGFHNGIRCEFHHAKEHADQLSDFYARGHNLHCTYSATVDFFRDFGAALLGQGGTVTPGVVKLLEQWQVFFESHPSDRLLQICHSRGAIEVNNALDQLPESLRKRIIVITIAPGCIIEHNQAYKVVNLLILSDPVVRGAMNRELLDGHHPHVIKLCPHSDNPDPHYMHGSSFRTLLAPMIATYIQRNDIDIPQSP